VPLMLSPFPTRRSSDLWLFHAGMLTAQTQTLAWTVIFFVASAAASSAYLTVSEIFPLEIRALAIAIFYATGTLAGGVGAPVLFRSEEHTSELQSPDQLV